MSVIAALYNGASGMGALSRSMQVIGNNIANVNTVGFKASRAEFGDLLSQSLQTPSGSNQIGRGVRNIAIKGIFSQGSFQNTSIVTDVAISGSGFFVVRDGDVPYYSREGQFRIDNEGYLVNNLGMPVEGYIYDGLGQPTGVSGPINLSTATAPPRPTGDGTQAGTGVSFNVNLDSTDAVMDAFDINDPSGTSNFSSAVTVYDSLGAPHSVMVHYNKTGENAWEWHALVDGAEITGGTPGVWEQEASGTLTFDANGQLTDSTTAAGSVFNFAGGAAQNQTIGFNFDATTQVATPSAVNSLTQDGYGPGTLQAIDIDESGVISGLFSNGQSRSIAQFRLANFPSLTGLERIGDNLFRETVPSGQPIYGQAGTGSFGSIAASTVELSNVDISEEFVNMITTQRGFQANSKIVTTGDTMLETVINMKR